MRQWLGLLLVAPLLAALLSGCLDPEPVQKQSPLRPFDPLGIPAKDLEDGGFYAFDHGGGPLRFTLNATGEENATAHIDLYGVNDTRVAGFQLNSGNPLQQQQITGPLAAGQLVMHARSLTGPLTIEDTRNPIDRFHPLASRFERHILAEAPVSTSIFGLGNPDDQPLEATIDITLNRTPAKLILYATSSHRGMQVEAIGDLGPVLEYTGTQYVDRPEPFLNDNIRDWYRLETTTHHENLRGHQLQVRIDAQHFEGTLMLEAWSYSRARIAIDTLPIRDAPEPAFEYGLLPHSPVWFEAGTRTQLIHLWNMDGDGDPAWVTLYDPHDHKMGTYPIPEGNGLAIPVTEAGAYVAILHDGAARLGLDAAGPDLQMHPLQLASRTLPEETANRNDDSGTYRQSRTAVEFSNGVPYTASLVIQGPRFDLYRPQDPLFGCHQDTAVQLLQGGEVLASAGDDITPPGGTTNSLIFRDAATRIQNTPVSILADGFGMDDCGRYQITVRAYVRPSQAT